MEMGTHLGNFFFLAGLAAIVLLEAAWLILGKKQQFPWREATANFAVALIKRLIDLATYGVAAGVLFWVYQYRITTIFIDSLWLAVVFFLLFEFAYYWHHRWAHEIRWLWATHSVHHSPNHMNLSVSARLGWTGLLSGSVLVFAPLVLIGFHPTLIFITLALSLFYQVFLHTEVIGKLGPLEWIFNTPSHHRAHHGSNDQYLDKNYGGVLIIYDRLFGTFAEEKEKVVYGLTEPLWTNNPFKIGLAEWFAIGKDVAKAKSAKHAFFYMFGRPGWQPSVKTTKQEQSSQS